MSGKRYTDEFRAEAVKQVLDRGQTVMEVSQRLGVHKHSLYEWVRVARVALPPAASPVAVPGSTPSARTVELRH